MTHTSKPAVGRIATALAATSVALGGSLLGGAATSPADAATLPQISVAHDMVKPELNRLKSMHLQFVRSGDVSAPSSMKVTVTDGTAVAGSDYTVVHTVWTVYFPAGSRLATVTVQIRGDRVVEPDETFDFTLSDAVGATLGDSAGAYTIVNDD